MTIEALRECTGIADEAFLRSFAAGGADADNIDASRCLRCGNALTPDDTGAHRKLVNRGATAFICVRCLAGFLGVTEPFLREKIEYFRKSGCTLFQLQSSGDL